MKAIENCTVNKISSIFCKALEDEDVHILVRRLVRRFLCKFLISSDLSEADPGTSSVMPLLSLCCHLLGDKQNTFITIEIEQNTSAFLRK